MLTILVMDSGLPSRAGRGLDVAAVAAAASRNADPGPALVDGTR